MRIAIIIFLTAVLLAKSPVGHLKFQAVVSHPIEAVQTIWEWIANE